MNKINCNKVKLKLDYENGLIKTKPIDNFDYFQQETYNKVIKYRDLPKDEYLKWYEKNIGRLFLVYIEKLTEKFGKQHFIYKSSFKYYVWFVEHNGCEAIILSAKTKGTRVEIILDDNGEPKGLVNDFFDEYKKLVQEFCGFNS